VEESECRQEALAKLPEVCRKPLNETVCCSSECSSGRVEPRSKSRGQRGMRHLNAQVTQSGGELDG
jgi:hypothetical protein